MKSPNGLHVAGILVVLHFALGVSGQNCYYPNGDVSKTDASCSSDGGACCPLGWDCLSNGLCYLGGSERYYGRYTCTDRSWGDDCPQYCTSNNTAAGNEAVVQCSDGSWCCDKNRDPTKDDCCSWDDKEVIDVPKGSTVTSITSTPTAPSSVPPTTNAAASTTPSTRSSITSTSSSAKSTITTKATSSDSTGGVVIITSILTTNAPTSTGDSDPKDATHHPDNSIVIGVGVAVPVAVLALSITLFVLWRRRKQKYAQRKPPTSDYSNNDISDMYSHSKHASEIDSYPVADVSGGKDKSRPISELTGSTHFMPGSPVSPRSSNGVSPPGYSPNVSGPGDVARGGWANSPTLPGVAEQPEPQELPPEGNPPRRSVHTPASVVPRQQQMAEVKKTGDSGVFKYEPYSQTYKPYRPEAQSANADLEEANTDQVQSQSDPFAAQYGRKSDEEVYDSGRFSPDPPQPIQGGLRVVN